DPLALGVRSHVVDRRQVEEMVHLPAELIDPVGAAEPLLGEVADHRNDAALLGAPAASELLQTPAGPLADEHVDRPLTLEQPLDQVAADETGAPGDEVTHLHPSTISTCGTYTAGGGSDQPEPAPPAPLALVGLTPASAIIKAWGFSTTQPAVTIRSAKSGSVGLPPGSSSARRNVPHGWECGRWPVLPATCRSRSRARSASRIRSPAPSARRRRRRVTSSATTAGRPST